MHLAKVPRLARGWCWLLAIATGLLEALPFPIAGPAPIWRTEIAWIALVPLLYVLATESSLRRSAGWGYVAGIVWYAANCYWVQRTMYLYGHMPQWVAAVLLVLFSLYLGLYVALFGLLVGLARRRGVAFALLAVPFCWVAMELACSRITSLPWDQLGVSQVDNLLLTRIAPLTGVYGLSFLIAAANALFATALLAVRANRKPLGIFSAFAGSAFVLVALVGIHRTLPPAPTQATVVMLQPNLNPDNSEAWAGGAYDAKMRNFLALSVNGCHAYYDGLPVGEPQIPPCATAVEPIQSAPPALVLWPEAPTAFEDIDPHFRGWLPHLTAATGAPMIIGLLGFDHAATVERPLLGPHHVYNSATFVDSEGKITARYDKMHLVPFGEFIPMQNLLFFARGLTANAGSMSRGQRRILFNNGGHSYGTFICYESIFADEVRQFVLSGADVLVNISDDGWYGDTSAPWQHLNMARMRAIENRRWILRDANSGVTTAIDPYGRLTVTAPRHIRTSLSAPFGYATEMTFYTRHGDVFGYGCAIISILFGVAGVSRRRSTARPQLNAFAKGK